MNKAVCFTGHREIPQGDIKNIKNKLDTLINRLTEEGYKDFYTGGAEGFDTLAALSVIGAMEKDMSINLHLAFPYRKNPPKDIEKRIQYDKILNMASTVTYVNENYRPSCFHERNRFMVDNSDMCVFYLTKASGGTYYTVKYASDHEKKVINILRTV